ncbi:hypothetical protein JYG34_13695 [Pseudomonas entomophila]|uniref:hypothetical protein n=1 Tax=Pseudomonas entomophila TaxID=312306 RepID=UPI001BCDF5E9|nr:hypothetical protein [Pseudomonas entomophila]QVM89089.1 hypothetical protein JYG34_13695 [Pseudomonas entomophila]
MSKCETPEDASTSSASKPVTSPGRLIVVSPKKEIVQDTLPFKLCRGAPHRLEIKAPEGSTWAGQKLCVLWMAGNSADAGTFFSHMAPPLKSEAGVDDEGQYQVLSVDGAKWTLTAKAGVEEVSGEIKLGLGSYWQARKYEFLAQVGDFHYEVAKLEWDRVVPIVDPLTKTTLTATVESLFDRSRLLSGKKVMFTLNGNVYAEATTAANGTATLVYAPKPEDFGAAHSVTFSAYCIDELDECSNELSQEVPVFATNPWPDQLEVELRDERGSLIPPTALAMRLTRKVKHKLTLKPKADSYFIGKAVSLAWPDESQLGIVFTPGPDDPDYERPMPEEGLSWDITGGMVSGRFALFARTPSIDLPFVLEGAQMSANLVDEVDVLIDEQEVLSPVILRRNNPRMITLKPKTGSPLAETEYKCWMTFTKGTLEPGSVEAEPKFKEEQPLEAGGQSWELKGLAFSGTCTLDVHVSTFDTTLKLAHVILLSQNLADEADLVNANDGTPLSPYFWIGESKRVSLKPKAGSPLLLAGLSATLKFVELEANLKQASLPADPPYDKGCDLAPETDVTWTIDPAKARGQFGLRVEVTDFSTPLKLEQAFLMSSVLSDEARVCIDDKEVGSTLIVMYRQNISTITLEPRDDIHSPLGKTALKGALIFIPDSLAKDQVPVEPPYDYAESMNTAGLLSWTRSKGNTQSGTFALGVEVEGFKKSVEIPEVMLISEQLQDELNLYFDHVPVAGPLLRITPKTHFFRVLPKVGSPLAGKAYQCSMLKVESRVNVLPGYDCARSLTSSSGLGWTMYTKVDSVEFSVALKMESPLASMSTVVTRPDKAKD